MNSSCDKRFATYKINGIVGQEQAPALRELYVNNLIYS